MRMLRRLAIWLIGLAIAGFIGSAVLTVSATYYFAAVGSDHIEEGEADVIIVLSAGARRGGTQLDHFSRARVERAVELWRAGVAPEILMSGGPIGPWLHIAETMKQYAIDLGVPEFAISIEGDSTTTFENARFTLDVAREEDWRTAVLVTDDYHMLRAWLLFEYWRTDSDVEIAALSPASGRSYARLRREVEVFGRETLAIPYNVYKVVAQSALDIVGLGDERMIQ